MSGFWVRGVQQSFGFRLRHFSGSAGLEKNFTNVIGQCLGLSDRRRGQSQIPKL